MTRDKSAKIFNELIAEIFVNSYTETDCVYRKYSLNNELSLIYSVSVKDKLRAICVPILSPNLSKKIETCYGIESCVKSLDAYTNDQLCICYTQKNSTDSMIFEIVAEDIREHLEAITDPAKYVNTINGVLKKWKNFFSTRQELLLSKNEELGLYGELTLLNKLIQTFGENIVNSWAGPKKETHDFYIGKNAIEVKTTSKQAPYQAHINSEYQLDKRDVSGMLYLSFFAFRRDESGPNTLPLLIKEIRNSLSKDDLSLNSFNEKLFKVGYVDSLEENYKSSYTLRCERLFCIKDDFPCIARCKLPKGINNVEYNVNIETCEEYQVNFKELKNFL